MENSYNPVKGNRPAENGDNMARPASYQQRIITSLSWLDLKVFYVRITDFELNDSTPNCLTVNHIPLSRNTLLEVSGVRTRIHSDGVSSLLRRDRLDTKSEEVTFVCTDSIRMTGSVKFEVFDKDVLLLSGVIELCSSNGCIGEPENRGQRWRMNCESVVVVETGFLKGKPYVGLEPALPRIEVYVTGSFAGTPIILTKTVQLDMCKKQVKKAMCKSIPEYEAAKGLVDVPSGLDLQMSDCPNCKPENQDYNNPYVGPEYLEGDDGELSWFNAGVRVGVGIGLSVCLGIGIGVGLLIRTCQGTRRRLL